MCVCQYCPDSQEIRETGRPRATLFNWVTALLVAGWVGIVAVAAELAGPEEISAVPTLEVFLRSLLGF